MFLSSLGWKQKLILSSAAAAADDCVLCACSGFISVRQNNCEEAENTSVCLLVSHVAARSRWLTAAPPPPAVLVFSREKAATASASSRPTLCRGFGRERECGGSSRASLGTEREDTWPSGNLRYEGEVSSDSLRDQEEHEHLSP